MTKFTTADGILRLPDTGTGPVIVAAEQHGVFPLIDHTTGIARFYDQAGLPVLAVTGVVESHPSRRHNAG